MRLQQLSSRSLRRSFALVTSKGLLTWVVWAAAIGMMSSVFVAWDGYRSSEGQSDATASRLAATVERDVARNLELLDLSLRSQRPADICGSTARHAIHLSASSRP